MQNTTMKRDFDADDDGAAKRARPDQPPSKVLHIRNLPADATEHEICALVLPYGQVEHILHMQQKSQALIQCDSVNTALLVVGAIGEMHLRGKLVRVQFSGHQQLVSRQTPNNVQMGGSKAPSRVLLVKVTDQVHPIDLEIMRVIFGKYGEVLRIATFSKNGQFNALIEMKEIHDAAQAQSELDCQNIYTGCCMIHVEFSQRDRIEIQHNSDTHRDFTRPDLGNPSARPPVARAMGMGMPPVGFPRQGFPAQNMGSVFGRNNQGGPGSLPAPHVMQPMGGLSQNRGLPNPAGMPVPSGMQPMSFPHEMVQDSAPGSVLLVDNLNEEEITPDLLFRLIGVFADVMRVKILYKKKDTALVQLRDNTRSAAVVEALTGVFLKGKDLRLKISRHNEVQLPREPTAEPLTSDFSNSKLHRFKNPMSKNIVHVYPPCAMLHISNIVENLDFEALTAAFGAYGTVKASKRFPQDPRMALIEMSTVAEAVEALVMLHDTEFKGSDTGRRIRVSFSKSKI
eukprot:m.178745 g.178745  ORF g.178745 m.178745 type:complete len:511 (-) comp31953_c2_seq3:324-1856(-)